ncbi:MAG: DUF3866 family protein [Firmicutes bacterium]|nr:DUF3866 family protein [Bacillota bacterium]
MPALNLRPAKVISIIEERPGLQLLSLRVGEQECRAVNYLMLGAKASPGDEVVVNTTAVDIGLGSGGVHFVLPFTGKRTYGWGHQVKLRYTPLQVQVDCVEEQNSPWHDKFQCSDGLEQTPVLVAELHSMLPPLVLAIRQEDPGARIVFVSMDGGALPVAFSTNLAWLRKQHLVQGTISCGHCYGGDLEAINIFTGLQAAKLVLNADYIIVSIGPGIAGTGTVYGFSGLEQGFSLQAVQALGGQAIFVPRISFADSRSRHHGISHHSLTVLRKAYSGSAVIPLPLLRQPQRRVLASAIRKLPQRYRFIWRQRQMRVLAARYPKLFRTMGRGYEQDPAFFDSLGAAAKAAVELNRSKR